MREGASEKIGTLSGKDWESSGIEELAFGVRISQTSSIEEVDAFDGLEFEVSEYGFKNPDRLSRSQHWCILKKKEKGDSQEYNSRISAASSSS